MNKKEIIERKNEIKEMIFQAFDEKFINFALYINERLAEDNILPNIEDIFDIVNETINKKDFAIYEDIEKEYQKWKQSHKE